MDDLAATTAPSFSPGWPFGRHMGTKIIKNTFPACRFYEKSSKCTSTEHPQAPKAVKMGSHCRSDQSKPKFFPDGGLSSKSNPPLKDGLISSFGLDCQMCGPLPQWVVLNVVFLVPRPLLFLSKWLHRAGVALHLGGLRGSYSSRTSILSFFKKTCFSGMSFFMFFLRIACQTDFKMCP